MLPFKYDDKCLIRGGGGIVTAYETPLNRQTSGENLWM